MDEGEDKEEYPQATDFSLTVTAKDGAGLTFYGSTQAGEGHRFVIGNVQAFDNADEKELPSAYNGPDFEDLDDKMQEHLDGMLADLGLDEQVEEKFPKEKFRVYGEKRILAKIRLGILDFVGYVVSFRYFGAKFDFRV